MLDRQAVRLGLISGNIGELWENCGKIAELWENRGKTAGKSRKNANINPPLHTNDRLVISVLRRGGGRGSNQKVVLRPGGGAKGTSHLQAKPRNLRKKISSPLFWEVFPHRGGGKKNGKKAKFWELRLPNSRCINHHDTKWNKNRLTKDTQKPSHFFEKKHKFLEREKGGPGPDVAIGQPQGRRLHSLPGAAEKEQGKMKIVISVENCQMKIVKQ